MRWVGTDRKKSGNNAAADAGGDHFQGSGRTLGIKEGIRVKVIFLERLADDFVHGGLLVHHGKRFMADMDRIQLGIAAAIGMRGSAACRVDVRNGEKKLFFCQRDIDIFSLLLFG